MDEQKLEIPFGWLSPDGDLWKCGYYEHSATAEEICKKLKFDYNYHGADNYLLSLGWCKIGLMSLCERKYWAHWEKPLTEYQRYFLNDYFIENKENLKFPLDTTTLCKYLYEDNFFDFCNDKN